MGKKVVKNEETSVKLNKLITFFKNENCIAIIILIICLLNSICFGTFFYCMFNLNNLENIVYLIKDICDITLIIFWILYLIKGGKLFESKTRALIYPIIYVLLYVANDILWIIFDGARINLLYFGITLVSILLSVKLYHLLKYCILKLKKFAMLSKAEKIEILFSGKFLTILILSIFFISLIFTLANGSGKKESDWDKLSDDEKQWYHDNYGNGKMDDYKDAIDDYKNSR